LLMYKQSAFRGHALMHSHNRHQSVLTTGIRAS